MYVERKNQCRRLLTYKLIHTHTLLLHTYYISCVCCFNVHPVCEGNRRNILAFESGLLWKCVKFYLILCLRLNNNNKLAPWPKAPMHLIYALEKSLNDMGRVNTQPLPHKKTKVSLKCARTLLK